MTTIAASSPTLSNVSGAVIVDIISAPTSNSSPSKMPRPITRINRAPVARAQTIPKERDRCQDNPAKNDCDTQEFKYLGELINEDVNLICQHATFLPSG